MRWLGGGGGGSYNTTQHKVHSTVRFSIRSWERRGDGTRDDVHPAGGKEDNERSVGASVRLEAEAPRLRRPEPKETHRLRVE